MSSLSAKDRVSLCSFTFSDGRRCRAPRVGNNTRFCPYHAQKEARVRAAQKLGKDLDYFFSGDYLSACDLSTALARLIPAVVRGDVKPKTGRTVAYMAQTLMQAIHLSKHEYINAFGTDEWREAIRTSVNSNRDYRFPPAPEPAQPTPSPAHPPSPVCHPERSEGPQTIPATQHSESPQPQPAQTPVDCHPDAVAQAFRPEESASSSNSSLATHHSPLPQSPQLVPSPHTPLPPTSAEFVQHVLARLQTRAGQASAVCHPERSEGSHPLPSTPFAPAAPTAQPNSPPQTAPSTPQSGPNRDAPWWHFGDTHHIRPDSHLL